MREHLEGEQADRLWQHLLHDDQIFNHRMSFFLVVETVLLGLVSVLYATEVVVALPITVLGAVLTLLWQYVQLRQYFLLVDLKQQAKRRLPEYRETLARRERWRGARRWLAPVPSTPILVFGVPPAILLVWVTLLIGLATGR